MYSAKHDGTIRTLNAVSSSGHCNAGHITSVPLHDPFGRQTLSSIPVKLYPGLQLNVQISLVTCGPEHSICPWNGSYNEGQGRAKWWEWEWRGDDKLKVWHNHAEAVTL